MSDRTTKIRANFRQRLAVHGRLWRLIAVALTGLAVVCLLALPPHAAHAGDLYVIASYPVSGAARDAVKAKKEAMDRGKTRAFRSLMKRILPVTDYARIPRLNGDQVEDLLDGFAVQKEQNSSTEYLAVLDFRFHGSVVREMLQSYGLSPVDQQAPPVTLLATVMPGEGGVATSPELAGTWRGAWAGLDLVNTATPIALKDVTPQIAPTILKQVAAGDAGALRVLKSEYGTDQIVVATTELDADGKHLNVAYAGEDAVGTFMLQRRYPIDNKDVGFASEMAAIIGLGILEGRWKAANAPRPGAAAAGALAAGGAERLSMFVRYNGMAEWMSLQRDLRRVPGLEDFDTGSVSARGAEVLASVPGGMASLEGNLVALGLTVRNEAGQWIVSRF